MQRRCAGGEMERIVPNVLRFPNSMTGITCTVKVYNEHSGTMLELPINHASYGHFPKPDDKKIVIAALEIALNALRQE
jgi:hypothetical protein